MQSGPFITFISGICQVDEKTLTVYARALKEAHLMTSGARGVNAPHLRPIDAARMIIALLATDRPAECVAAVMRFRALPYRPDLSDADVTALGHDGVSTLEQALVRVVALDPDPLVWAARGFPAVEVVRNDKSASLIFGGAKLAFRSRQVSPLDREGRRGIWRQHSLIPATVSELATGLWADRFRGSDVEGRPLNLDHPLNDLAGLARERRHAEIYDYLRQRDADWREGA